ncbi:MAG: alpha/beta hydrolase [bacterium]
MLRKAMWGLGGIAFLVWGVIHLWPQPAYSPMTLTPAYIDKAHAWAAENFPSIPAEWHWQERRVSDGALLRIGQISPPSPKARIIFVPGYGSTLDLYADLMQDLVAHNFELIGVDLRGQGGSARALPNPEKHWVRPFRRYSDDIAEIISSEFSDSTQPTYIMGESFGGHVILRSAAEHKLSVDGIILVAPAVKVKTPFPYWMAYGLVETNMALGFSKHYAIGQGNWQPWNEDFAAYNFCTSYPPRQFVKDVFLVDRPEQRVGGATYQWLDGIMNSTRKIMNTELLQHIKAPVLAFAASDDKIVSSLATQKICNSKLPNCSYIELPDTHHCLLFEEPEIRQEIIQRIDDLLEQQKAVSSG